MQITRKKNVSRSPLARPSTGAGSIGRYIARSEPGTGVNFLIRRSARVDPRDAAPMEREAGAVLEALSALPNYRSNCSKFRVPQGNFDDGFFKSSPSGSSSPPESFRGPPPLAFGPAQRYFRLPSTRRSLAADNAATTHRFFIPSRNRGRIPRGERCSASLASVLGLEHLY